MKAGDTTKAMGIMMLFFLLLSAGCTNVAGDQPRIITSKASATDALIRTANAFFMEAGYQCDVGNGARLRCRKDLRDLYIHQTHAVVEIFQDAQPDSFVLVTTRWDEGMIPGELIDSDFRNEDVGLFCESLQARGLGSCEVGRPGA